MYGNHPHHEEHAMYTDDIINVPADDTPEFEPTTTIETVPTVSLPGQPVHDGHLSDDPATPSDSSNRGAVIAAVIATVVLFAAMGLVLVRGAESSTAATPSPTEQPSVVPISTTPPTSPQINPEPTVPVVPVPPSITAPPVDTTPPVVPEPVAPPVAPPVETIPPVVPPGPAGELAVQADYVLDPGVDAVSIVLSNHGDLELNYEIVNDGEGFNADQPAGAIDAGASANVWIALDLVSDGDGPTLFQQAVVVESDGGDAVIAISGQVEKPGFIVAEFESLPIVDYRATVRFTNLGGLPVDIVGLEAPGLRYAPIPEQIAAGETLELDVAVCDGGAPLPIMIPMVQPFPAPPKFAIGSSVTLETVAGPDAEAQVNSTNLLGNVDTFEPLDCSPIVAVPVGDITIALGG